MMKKQLLFLLLCLPVFFFSCEDDDSPLVQPITFDVMVKYSSAYGNQVAPDLKVTALNVDSKLVTETTSNSVGVATFKDLPVGIYDISVSKTYTPAQFFEFSGQTVENDVVFNATLTNQTINTSSPGVLELELRASPVGNLVIKQIYFAGSHTKDGALYRDQFIEIYNNSDQIQYADGLYFGQVYGKGSTSVDPAYLQSNGQYDWSKSIGMPSTINANADYLYMETLFQLPGTGTQYPIAPGESIVIAQNAINHKAPYQDQNGKTITPNNPDLTVDLSGANFEAYYGEGFASDLDNPAVPNIRLHYAAGKDMILDTNGRDSYIIFKLDGEVSTLQRYPRPSERVVDSETVLYYQVPVSKVIDAVEGQESSSKLLPKKIQNDFDAGYMYVPLGRYSSQSVIRKIAKTFNGRNILQDTNNSTNDFKVLDRAAPRGF